MKELGQSDYEMVCFYVCGIDSHLGTFYINPYNYTKIEKHKKIQVFTSEIKGLKSIVSSDKKNV